MFAQTVYNTIVLYTVMKVKEKKSILLLSRLPTDAVGVFKSTSNSAFLVINTNIRRPRISDLVLEAVVTLGDYPEYMDTTKCLYKVQESTTPSSHVLPPLLTSGMSASRAQLCHQSCPLPVLQELGR
jgi:hypothetical protein